MAKKESKKKLKKRPKHTLEISKPLEEMKKRAKEVREKKKVDIVKNKEEILKKKKRDELIEELRKSFLVKLRKFRKKHKCFQHCYPNGRIQSGPDASEFIQKEIYLCYALCGERCREFEKRTYVCKDLGCDDWSGCCYISDEKSKKICKKKKLLKERKARIKLYKEYFLVNKIYRGLKIDPDKTLAYLRKRKEKKNGKRNTLS